MWSISQALGGVLARAEASSLWIHPAHTAWWQRRRSVLQGQVGHVDSATPSARLPAFNAVVLVSPFVRAGPCASTHASSQDLAVVIGNRRADDCMKPAASNDLDPSSKTIHEAGARSRQEQREDTSATPYNDNDCDRLVAAYLACRR